MQAPPFRPTLRSSKSASLKSSTRGWPPASFLSTLLVSITSASPETCASPLFNRFVLGFPFFLFLAAVPSPDSTVERRAPATAAWRRLLRRVSWSSLAFPLAPVSRCRIALGMNGNENKRLVIVSRTHNYSRILGWYIYNSNNSNAPWNTNLFVALGFLLP